MRAFEVILRLSVFLMPTFTLAADENVQTTDYSVHLLAKIFGRLVTDDPAYDIKNTLSFQLVSISLEICLLAAFTVGALTLVLQTVRGAHDGNLLSKESSSTFNPIKQLAGIALLIPTKSGFSYIQSFFMSLVLQGIVLANSMWDVVLEAREGNISSTQELENTLSEPAEKLALSLYKAAGALRVAEKRKPTYTNIGISRTNRLYLQDSNENIIEVAQVPFNFQAYARKEQLDPQAEQRAREFIKNLIIEISQYTLISQKYETYFSDFDVSAQNENSTVSGTQSQEIEQWALSTKAEFFDVAQRIQDFVQIRLERQVDENRPEKIQGGWLLAGTQYWDYVGLDFKSGFSESSREQQTRNFCDNSCDLEPRRIYIDYLKIFNEQPDLNEKQNYYTSIGDFFDIYYNYVTQLQEQQNQLLENQDTVINFQNKKKFWDEMRDALYIKGLDAGNVGNMSQLLLEQIFPKSNFDFRFDQSAVDQVFSQGDPLKVYIEHNLGLLLYVMWTTIGFAVLAAGFSLASSKMSGFYSGFSTGIWILLYVFMLIFSMLAIIVPSAILGSFFLAILPGVIFFAASLAWLFRVVEVVIVAPLIAVILLLPPSQGQARTRNAANQVLVVIFKPALMIIGFVMAIRLVSISVLFSSASLSELIVMVHGQFKGAIFEFLFFLGLIYNLGVGLVIAMATRAFGAIYIIPDQVFGAVGIQGESDDESRSFVSALEQSAKKGAEDTSKILTTFTSVIGSHAALKNNDQGSSPKSSNSSTSASSS